MIREEYSGAHTDNSSTNQSSLPKLDNSIEVVVRVRPLFDREVHCQTQYSNPVVTTVQDNVIFLLDPHEGSDSKFERLRHEESFAFDAAFDALAANLEVYFYIYRQNSLHSILSFCYSFSSWYTNSQLHLWSVQ